FVVYLVPLGVTPGFWNPNEMSHAVLSVSLAEYGTIQVDRVLDDYGRVPQDLSVRDGHAYSDKAPGLSLFGAAVLAAADRWIARYRDSSAPDYWPLHHLLTALLVSLPGALFGVLVFRHLPSTHGASVRDGLALAVVFLLATPWLTYASVLFSHVTAGAVAGTAFLLACRLDATDGAVVERRAALIGLLASLAVTIEYPTVLLALVVAVAVCGDQRRRQTVPAFVVGAVFGALPLLIYNKSAWGSYFTTGYAFKASTEHAAIHAQGLFGVRLPTVAGLWGVLVSAQRGLLFYSPSLVCVGVGLARRWRADRREAALTIAAIVAYVGFASGFVDWQGGWSAGSRHLVPLLALLVVPFAAGLRAMLEKRWSAMVAAALVGCSVSAAILCVAVTPFFPETFANPLGDVAVRSLADGYARQNLVSDAFGASPIGVMLVFAAVVVVAVATAATSLVPRAYRRSFAVVLLAAALAFPLFVRAASSSESPEVRASRRALLTQLGFSS
ncbi:MAG TPA: hypothetical protein VF483_06985, partial [Gemmatimonadaceae bacterium]